MPSVTDHQPAGKHYWRSLNELADTPEFRRYVEREFPHLEEDGTSVNRRQFLKIMSASMALGGLTACRRPVETIVPYAKAPEEVLPGVPNHFATTMPLGEQALGLVVTSFEGRPTKIEGNELHPVNRGKTNEFMQGEILNMYDPDRMVKVLKGKEASSWDDFLAEWATVYPELVSSNGASLAVLTQSSSSPTLKRLEEAFKATFSQATWATYEPVSNEDRYEGINIGCGEPLRPIYHLEKADTVLTIDSDILLTEDDSLRNVREFANRRRDIAHMNRLYSVETMYTVTGGMADYRLRLKRSAMASFVVALARELGVKAAADAAAPTGIDQAWVKQVAEELRGHRGHGLVIGGRSLPAEAQALILAINDHLGAIGSTVTYVGTNDLQLSSRKQLASLADALANETISTVIILGGDPAFTAPVEVKFAEALAKAKLSIHLSAYNNSTSALTHWRLPATHFLEEWGDARATDGTLGLIQPLISPLYEDAHSAIELVNVLTTGSYASGYELVQATWKEADYFGGGAFNTNWRRTLHDGVLADSGLPQARVVVDHSAVAAAITKLPAPIDGLEVAFQVSPTIYDGRYANNGWLQESPDPITKITWENAAIVSPVTAEKLGLHGKVEKVQDLSTLGQVDFPLVTVTVNSKPVTLALYVLPGHADDCISIDFGYGQKATHATHGKVDKADDIMKYGRVALEEAEGANVYPLRSLNSPYGGSATISATGGTRVLAITQDHHSMEARPLIREANAASWTAGKHVLEPVPHEMPTVQLWESPADYSKGYQWGMAIDLNTCIGCNACLVACQSENNIPIVGKDQVSRGRELHWIRIDRYFAGTDVNNPDVRMQPMPCQHCENAPCEQVCPVQATTHDSEGLNVMVYNRCIGTRYCSNNCPFKVRRFNFFNYSKDLAQPVKMQQNPNVSIRFRGVMEKCTFCTQRINQARIDAKLDEREIQDGDLQTACQQACPASAIAFGNINDPESEVSKLKSEQNKRNYTLLEILNIRPRTSYLGKITNRVEKAGGAKSDSHGDDHGHHEEAH